MIIPMRTMTSDANKICLQMRMATLAAVHYALEYVLISKTIDKYICRAFLSLREKQCPEKIKVSYVF